MPITKIGLIALLATLTVSDLLGGTLTNNPPAVGDVLLCFRKSGGANDMVVDLGPVSKFINATTNQRIAITNYTGGQLALVGTNSVIWSVFSYYDSSVAPASAQWTLFMSRARSNPYAKSLTWDQASQGVNQLPAIAYMSTVMPGAAENISYNANNTPYAVIEPDNNTTYQFGQSYATVIGPDPYNFNGFWADTPEATSPSNFTTVGKVMRSDFYQCPPNDTGAGPVKYLGYFEFNTNGAMTYVGYPTVPTVTTLAASAITGTNAQLNATINPNADATIMLFQYGLTTSYGSTSATNAIGTASGTYGLSVSNLVAGTLYHFRAVAYNAGGGTNYGSDLNFTTPGGVLQAPVITSFVRSNGVSYVKFTTGNSGTYTLRGTNAAGLGTAQINWPPIASVAGNGQTNTLQDASALANKLYLISAQ